MKKLLFTILTTSALTASLFAAQNEKFTGKDNWVTGGAAFTFKPSSTLNIPQTVSAPDVYRLLTLGAPVAANPAVYVATSTAMKNTPDYTLLAGQSGDALASGVLTLKVARNITVTHTVATGSDTLGVIRVVGTDINGNALTEDITPLSGTIASGVKAFKTITRIFSVGWVTNGGSDTIAVGSGDLIGLPVIPFSIVGNILFKTATTAITQGVVAKGTSGNIGEATVSFTSDSVVWYLQSRW